MADSILLIGGGGREHALAWKLSQSSAVKHVYVAPGNAGTNTDGNISNCNIDVKNHAEVSNWCKTNNITLVVVGPEDPLANGLADHLTNAGIKCFGPCQKAAQIEASKEFAKSFMDRYQIPTARWKSFTDANDAKNFILSAPYNALVVKASGLAAGKGVIVASSKNEAVEAVNTLKQDKGLSAASDVIVIEELLEGEEVSVLCFSDGVNISVMPPAQDHKRLLDGDEGPNTGGMGAYCRYPLVSESTLDYIKSDILQRTIDGMKESGMPYIGVLYAGLMMTKDGPKVLEFNCRFGDPETQVILPLLNSDLYNIMLSCVDGTLNNIKIQWSTNKEAVGIVLVSAGYPGTYPKGKIITGLDKMDGKYLIFHAGTSLSSGNVVTSGGRVLAVVALGSCLADASNIALEGCKVIDFEGKFYRNDIAGKALRKSHSEGMTYKSAGVDIDSADDLVKKIKTLTKQTLRPEVCGGIGGFGGIFELSGYSDPYLVSSVESLGEKLKVLQDCFEYEMAGYDLVASAVNQILCHGAEPHFFLDTFTCGKLDVNVAAEVVTGIAKACKDSNCALIGGETAEMPGMYADGDFDLTSFARGAVERCQLLPKREDICDGDVAIGLISSSLNCSGYRIIKNLMRKLELTYDSTAPFDNKLTLKDAFLCPSKIYVGNLLPLMQKGCIKAAAHLNKDGLTENENIDKAVPDGCTLVLDATKWTVPPVLNWIATNANFSKQDIIKHFNLGVDLLLVVDKKAADELLQSLHGLGEKAASIGVIRKISAGEEKVKIMNLDIQKCVVPKRKIAVITSAEGTNLEAIIRHINNPTTLCDAEITVVVSDMKSESLRKAHDLNVIVEVVDNDKFKTALEIENAINEILKYYSVDLICVDGYKKEFSDQFLTTWNGRILNIHPSILPAFNSTNACQDALSMGARVSGCTVYLVQAGNQCGKILEQDAFIVEPHDTEESLLKKIQHLQEFTYPKAIETFISGKKSGNVNHSSFESTLDNKLNKRVGHLLKSTSRPGFINESCYDVFALKDSGYQNPYLVSGTDGVGTKLKIAQTCNKHDTIGIDLVAMCVNDILTHGAEPLLFLQSFDCGSLNSDTASSVISGIAEGCKQANCALIGSEINELPDIYLNQKQCIQDFDSYDVVGYAEGAVDKLNLLPRLNEIQEDDVLIGIASSGVHSNGYSLVRKLVEVKNFRYQDPFPLDPSTTIGEVLLTPTKIYVRSLLPLMKQKYIKAAAHITGGGLTENIPRVLPPTFRVVLDGGKWDVPPVLQWIATEGQLSEKEMLKTFNCGLGMVLIIDKRHEREVLASLNNCGEAATTIGSVKLLHEGEERVEINNFKLPRKINVQKKKRVAVLISGTGSNLQALINYTQNPNNCSQAEIVLVVSNIPDAGGLQWAEKANIPTKVLSHKGKKRVEFDMAVNEFLKESKIEIVCLAGFMRILSKEFVELWQGNLLNLHPALLPSFKGANGVKLALEAGVKITGCTVHFVEPEVDAGAIVQQAAVRIDQGDDENAVHSKIRVLEHLMFPAALELVASGRVSRDINGKAKWHF